MFKQNSQPLNTKNAGCVFKNPRGLSAGALLVFIISVGYYITPALVGGTDGQFYGLKANTGEKVWQVEVSKRAILNSALYKDGTVYITHGEENINTTQMGMVAAFDIAARSGQLGHGFDAVIAAENRSFRTDTGVSPRAIAARFVADYGLPEYDATTLTQSKAMGAYFEEAARASGQPKLASNWIMGEVSRRLNAQDLAIEAAPVQAATLARLIQRIADGTVSNNAAKQVMDALWAGEGQDVDAVIEAKGLKQMNDSGALEAIIDEVMAANAPMMIQEAMVKGHPLGWTVQDGIAKNAAGANNLVSKETFWNFDLHAEYRLGDRL